MPYLGKCVFPNINWRGVWTHHESRWECVKVAYTILQLKEYNPHFMRPYIPGFICREVKRRESWLVRMHHCYQCGVLLDICSEYNANYWAESYIAWPLVKTEKLSLLQAETSPTKSSTKNLLGKYTEAEQENSQGNLSAKTTPHLSTLKQPLQQLRNILQDSYTSDSSQTMTGSQQKDSYFSWDSTRDISAHTIVAPPVIYQSEFGVMKDLMFECEVRYPISPIYHNPDFATTGISLKDRHYIRARYFAKQHPVPKNQAELLRDCPGIAQLDLAALITLWEDVFPNWFPNKEQHTVRNANREEINNLEHCNVCTLIKGSYCNAPVSRNSPHCPPPTAPRTHRGSKHIQRNIKRN